VILLSKVTKMLAPGVASDLIGAMSFGAVGAGQNGVEAGALLGESSDERGLHGAKVSAPHAGLVGHENDRNA
jgi:hypothetical protein